MLVDTMHARDGDYVGLGHDLNGQHGHLNVHDMDVENEAAAEREVCCWSMDITQTKNNLTWDCKIW